MNTLDWAILAACVAAVLNAIILIRVGHRLPGRRSAIWVITCPETRTSVVVEISERQPVSRLAADHSQFEVKDCSLWPQSQGCLRVCLDRVKPRPGSSLVLTDSGT